MDAIRAWFAQLQLDNLWQMLIMTVSCVLCVSFHETCHGLMAYAFGDPTAKRAGRLTLNPLKHIDIVGLVILAIVKFGWAKPVPVDMRNFRNPKAGMAFTAMAGPLGNVILAAVCLLLNSVCVFYLVNFQVEWLFYVHEFLFYTAVLSTGLAVFNLFPVPPLDGSKILFALLPQDKYYQLMRFEQYGMVVMVLLLFTGLLDAPLFFLRDGMLKLLSGLCSWPYDLLQVLYF